jgi:hypothetical protein
MRGFAPATINPALTESRFEPTGRRPCASIRSPCRRVSQPVGRTRCARSCGTTVNPLALADVFASLGVRGTFRPVDR